MRQSPYRAARQLQTAFFQPKWMHGGFGASSQQPFLCLLPQMSQDKIPSWAGAPASPCSPPDVGRAAVGALFSPCFMVAPL